MGTPSWDVGETAERCENKAGWAGRGWQVWRTGWEAGAWSGTGGGGPVHLLRRHAKYSFTNLWSRRAGPRGSLCRQVWAGEDRGRCISWQLIRAPSILLPFSQLPRLVCCCCSCKHCSYKILPQLSFLESEHVKNMINTVLSKKCFNSIRREK